MAESRPTCQTKGQGIGSGSRDTYLGKSIGKIYFLYRLCRDKVRRTKVRLELNSARNAKNNKRASTGMSVRKARLKKVYPPNEQEWQPRIHRRGEG